MSLGVDIAIANYRNFGKEIAKEISNEKLIEIARCGHRSHIESPAKFHAAVLEFSVGNTKPIEARRICRRSNGSLA